MLPKQHHGKLDLAEAHGTQNTELQAPLSDAQQPVKQKAHKADDHRRHKSKGKQSVQRHNQRIGFFLIQDRLPIRNCRNIFRKAGFLPLPVDRVA